MKGSVAYELDGGAEVDGMLVDDRTENAESMADDPDGIDEDRLMTQTDENDGPARGGRGDRGCQRGRGTRRFEGHLRGWSLGCLHRCGPSAKLARELQALRLGVDHVRSNAARRQGKCDQQPLRARTENRDAIDRFWRASSDRGERYGERLYTNG